MPAEDIKITNDKDHIEEDYKKWPIFVKPFKSRGTISSSVVLFKNNNEIEFIEKSWNEFQELKFEKRIKL